MKERTQICLPVSSSTTGGCHATAECLSAYISTHLTVLLSPLMGRKNGVCLHRQRGQTRTPAPLAHRRETYVPVSMILTAYIDESGNTLAVRRVYGCLSRVRTY